MTTPRLIDAVMLGGELDLLEVRLKYMAPFIDRFIVTECDHNHAGVPTEPVFLKNRARFKDFPIEYVLVMDLPGGPNNWPRVWHHRISMARGLSGIRDTDIVLTSDLDEIPRDSVLRDLRAGDTRVADGEVLVCDMAFLYYQPTIQSVHRWTGTRITTAKTLRELGAQAIRHRNDHEIKDGGWHFSYFGGAEAIQKKIQAIAESAHLDAPEYTDLEKIRARVAAAADLYDRADQSWRRVPLDPTMPPGIEQFIWPEEKENA